MICDDLEISGHVKIATDAAVLLGQRDAEPALFRGHLHEFLGEALLFVALADILRRRMARQHTIH